ncbi:MAG: cation-translocating P-type ATPase [Promethearchaeota archaeon]
METIKEPWIKPKEDVLKELNVDPLEGLTSAESKNRLEKYGPNILIQEKTISFFKVFRHEVAEPMIILLLIVGILYSFFGNIGDAITIFIIITILIFVEIYNEYNAKKTIASLKKLASPVSTVIRNKEYQEVITTEIVPGDILLLKLGQKIPADLRLLEAYGLQIDESVLTGESIPIVKNDDVNLAPDTELMERINMGFAGTTITRGKGKGVVVNTSLDTELGRIAGLVKGIKEPKTPLQLAMKQLTTWLVFVAVGFCILIPVIGILQGRDLILMILTGLSLSFATIPEELPIIIMVVLALGAMVLSRRNALVKTLNAAETLGSVTVIATDKTGTITENKLKVSYIYTNGKLVEYKLGTLTSTQRRLLEIGALANDVITNKVQDKTEYLGDPMDIALIKAARDNIVNLETLFKEYHLMDECSFDNQRMMMSQIYERDNKYYMFVKGATESILNRSAKIVTEAGNILLQEDQIQTILGKVNEMAEKGLRILAIAYKEVEKTERCEEDNENSLIFVGLVGFIDPPREEVKDAITATKNAGVRIIMITGDYEITAKNIAKTVGIDSKNVISGKQIDGISDQKLKEIVNDVSIYARATPVHKLKIVKALKENGEIVAVTGDGINDAPALKMADIGVAMGLSGTDVARETADMVLLDDNFATITEAVKEGRKLYDNLRKGVKYYLSVKMALIIIFLLPLLFNIPLPFAPIQIILLELFMDLAASATFVVEPSEGDAMLRKPRNPKQKFMDKKMQLDIFAGGLSLCVAVLTVYFLAVYLALPEAQTLAFATWMVCHILLALNMRTERDPLSKIGILSNKMIIIWALAAFIVLISLIYIPLLQVLFKVIELNLADWILIVLISFLSTFWLEAKKIVKCK